MSCFIFLVHGLFCILFLADAGLLMKPKSVSMKNVLYDKLIV